jgi:hypothetical protein
MPIFSTLATYPAVWGTAGAFCFAGQRILWKLALNRDAREAAALCVAEFFFACIVGAIWAGAIDTILEKMSHLSDLPATSAVIGLLANTVAPVVTKRWPKIVDNILSGRVSKALTGDTRE